MSEIFFKLAISSFWQAENDVTFQVWLINKMYKIYIHLANSSFWQAENDVTFQAWLVAKI